MRLSFCGAAIAGALLAYDAPAAANGRLPASNHVVFAPSGPSAVVVRATYGLLVSRDHGATWSFLCEEALGLAPDATEDPPLGITAAPALVVGTLGSLNVSRDFGCNWACVGGALANRTVVDVAVRPDAPHAIVALVSNASAGVDGALTFDSRLFESRDDGATWSPLGTALDPGVIPDTVEVAASDPSRVYVSGTRGFGADRTASVFASADAAVHWTEHPIPLASSRSQDRAFLAGVDPTSADVLYVRTNGRSDLLVSSDGGRSFASVLALEGTMLGFALSPDGTTVYAGSVEDGLFTGARGSTSFTPRNSIAVQCLAAHGAELWACSDEARSGFVVGVSADDGATFTPRLHLAGVGAPLACAAGGPTACGADANASQCAGAPFAQLCATPGCASAGSSASTAAATSASSDTGSTPVVAAKHGGCACRAADGAANTATETAPTLFGSLAALLAFRKARRPR